MTRIESSGRIAEIIRKQVDEMRGAGNRTASATREDSKTKPATLQTSAELDAVIARRIRAIDVQDPQRRRKAFRVFLESVLLAELGESMINDAGFYQLVEQVQEQMEADPALTAAIDEAAILLLAEDTR